MRNAVTHGSSADHADLLNVHTDPPARLSKTDECNRATGLRQKCFNRPEAGEDLFSDFD
jgi:hypothetical protein